MIGEIPYVFFEYVCPSPISIFLNINIHQPDFPPPNKKIEK